MRPSTRVSGARAGEEVQSGYWQDLTSGDFEALDPERTVALLPVAAVEQHGPHLPLATDALINSGLVAAALDRLAGRATVLVLPALSIGHSLEHADFPGTLSAGLETLLALWTDVARGVARAGVRKLVVLNTHGGQSALVHLAAVRLRAELELLVVRANYFAFGAPEGLFDERELRYGLHGGEVETSLMLHLHPELVRHERARDFGGLPARLADRNRLLGVEKPIGMGWLSRDLGREGVCGNAARADARRGKLYLEHLAGCLADLLAETAGTPLETLQAGSQS
ncbi:MAG TPA: creatininase family protein [Gammaproteobacteria bacterium]|nr:creatininase family protein [Gammaproteobacteria bacterium]